MMLLMLPTAAAAVTAAAAKNKNNDDDDENIQYSGRFARSVLQHLFSRLQMLSKKTINHFIQIFEQRTEFPVVVTSNCLITL